MVLLELEADYVEEEEECSREEEGEEGCSKGEEEVLWVDLEEVEDLEEELVVPEVPPQLQIRCILSRSITNKIDNCRHQVQK